MKCTGFERQQFFLFLETISPIFNIDRIYIQYAANGQCHICCYKYVMQTSFQWGFMAAKLSDTRLCWRSHKVCIVVNPGCSFTLGSPAAKQNNRGEDTKHSPSGGWTNWGNNAFRRDILYCFNLPPVNVRRTWRSTSVDPYTALPSNHDVIWWKITCKTMNFYCTLNEGFLLQIMI